ncbi:MAG: hypothetical protein RSB41_04320 [Bacilli bacterium]
MDYIKQMEKYSDDFKKYVITEELVKDIKKDLDKMSEKDIHILKLNLENKILSIEKYNYNSAISIFNTISAAFLGFTLAAYNISNFSSFRLLITTIIVILFISFGLRLIKNQNERLKYIICYCTFYLKIIDNNNNF